METFRDEATESEIEGIRSPSVAKGCEVKKEDNQEEAQEVDDDHFTCEECGAIHHKDNMREYEEYEYCKDCFFENFNECCECGEVHRYDDLTETTNGYVCNSCYNDYDYFQCVGCEEILPGTCYGDDGYCEDCARDREEEDEQDDNERPYYKGNDLVEEDKRAFSCEIESYYNDYDDYRNAISEIDSRIGYTNDGSLGGDSKEFQTPKLSGEKGEKVLQDLCKTLNEKGFYVNKTCGLHIHLDTSDFAGDINKLKKLILFYMFIEPLLLSYLPYSRRTNRYCLPLSEFYHQNEIAECYDIAKLEEIWYREQSAERIESRKKNRYDSTRYAGVNLHSLLSNGHIEIRHHSGTIDYTKIINWIRLHTKILDRISQGYIKMDEIIKLRNILLLSAKQKIVFEMLDLEKDLQKYFIARSKKFGGEIEENNETLCAE